METGNEPNAQAGGPAASKGRLLALDVLRGLTFCCMVLVNSPGDGANSYRVLQHVSWHGWAISDLVFPFFLFVVGVAIPFSIESRLRRGASHGQIVANAFRRSVILFVIGVVMNWYVMQVDFSDWSAALDLGRIRIFNVLQRIAICYFVAVLMYLRWTPRAHFAAGAGILIAYFILMMFVPVPGHGAGNLNPIGNWVQYIDARVLGSHCGFVIDGQPFEKKGLLSTFPALVTVLIGMWAGRRLRRPEAAADKLVPLFFFGALGMWLGLCWNLVFPINQDLWTSSMVLFMGGMAVTALASLVYLVDVRGSKWWTPPLFVFGRSSVAVWIISVTGYKTFEKIKFTGADGELTHLRAWLVAPLSEALGPQNGSLVYALLFVALCWGILALLARKGISLKV